MARKMKKFADGGNTISKFAEDANERVQQRANQGAPAKSAMYKAEPGQRSTGLKRETFGDAFARARRNGEKTFEFKGKKYTTETAAEKAARTSKDSVKNQEPMSFRDISNSPRIADMKKARDLAAQAASNASERESVVNRQEQARLADIAKRGAIPESEFARSKARLGATQDTTDRTANEAVKRAEMLRRDAAERGDDSEGMKRGGKVKKYARGGTVKASSASRRADGIAQRGKTRGKMY